MHFLDKYGKAVKPDNDDDKFFKDAAYSNDYVAVDTPVGKTRMSQVDNHELQKSKNLESIFEKEYRKKSTPKFVPLFDMISTMFGGDKFAPPQLDLGKAILYSEAKPTDIISGLEGNFGNHGWVVSTRLFELLKQFNIGRYQPYKIVIQSKKKDYPDYVYLHFISYADKFIDYSRSKFYTEQDDEDTRKVITFESAKDMKQKKLDMNKGLSPFDNGYTYVHPKEIYMQKNTSDFFQFKDLICIDTFMAANLAKKILSEGMTGFKFIQTRMVKDSVKA